MCFRGLRFIDDATEKLIDDAKEKTQVMDHSLNNVFALSTKQKQITAFSKEGLLFKDENGKKEDRRTKIDFGKTKFRLYSYTTLCQMKVWIKPNSTAVGSCSRLMLHGRHYIFTCAHNLVIWNTLKDLGKNIEAGFVYTMRQGEHKWAQCKKILVKEILVHPNYDGSEYCGFDIAVAPIMHHHTSSISFNFTRKNDVAWAPTEPESIEEGLKIEVAGFPGEKDGCSYVHCGKIVGKRKTKKGGWLIFYDVDTTPGNSGSDINVIDKTWVQSWFKKRGRSSSKSKVCIGVHNGHCEASGFNYGTLITPAIERWLSEKTKEKKVVFVN